MSSSSASDHLLFLFFLLASCSAFLCFSLSNCSRPCFSHIGKPFFLGSTKTLHNIQRPVRATITLYPIGRPVRATITLYPIGRTARATITLYPIGRPVAIVTESYHYHCSQQLLGAVVDQTSSHPTWKKESHEVMVDHIEGKEVFLASPHHASHLHG